MKQIPERAIEEAAAASPADAHDHDGVTGEDGTLSEHLRGEHQLEVPPTVSPATQQGLHDRLHGKAKAADD